jgi:hypothetical protein
MLLERKHGGNLCKKLFILVAILMPTQTITAFLCAKIIMTACGVRFPQPSENVSEKLKLHWSIQARPKVCRNV